MVAIASYKPTMAKHNATLLNGVSGQSINAGLEQHMFQGDLDSHHVANLQSIMNASFNTTDLKGILDITGISAAQLTATNKLTLYWRQQAEGGTFTGGANDFSSAMQDGMIAIDSISGSHGQAATCSVSVTPTYDGTNNPITLSKTDTAPTETVQDYAYTISQMKFGNLAGDTIPLESINVNFGLNIETIGGDGEAFPSFATLSQRNPTITLTTRDLGKAFDYDLLANYDGTDDLFIYFARLEPGASRYSDGSSQHIKFTISAHSMMTDSVSENTASITIKPIWDGTNAIMTIATASTIA
jgi:hypothetical protein